MTRPDPALRRGPSIAAGIATAWRLRRLVFVLWVASHLLLAPVWGIAVVAFGGSAAARLQPGGAEGEWLVVAIELARPVAWPLALAVVGAVVAGWAWTVLWRAGVVTWAVWGAPGPPRLAEILGHGVVRWWRFGRLHAAAAVALGVAVTGVALVVANRLEVAARQVAQGSTVGWAVAAFGVTAALAVAVGAATAAGCWRLGTPGLRSALRALGQGASAVGRHPARTAAVTVAWWSGAAALAVAPVWVAVRVADPTVTVAVLEASLVLRAACRVGFFGSFLPLLGIDSQVAPRPG